MKKRLCRQELYDLVWSTPMKTLAAQFGISDVGLKKTCSRAEIPSPDRGYWAKREAGKEMPKMPLPKRPPGMNHEVLIGRGNSWYCEPAYQLSDPPPVPPKFSEPIEEVRLRIAQAIGKLSVRQKVMNWHPVIDHLLKADEQRREQQRLVSYMASWHGPEFDSPIERRRLRILNTLFFAAGKMNGRPSMSNPEPGRSNQEPRSVHVSFYDQHVGIALEQPGHPRRAGQFGPKSSSSNQDSKLCLSILDGTRSEAAVATWLDNEDSKIESHVTDIAVQLVLTAEVLYRNNAVRRYEWLVERRSELEEKERQRKIEAERAEQARRRQIEQARIDRLLKDAAAFQRANEIRKYVKALRSLHDVREIAAAEKFDRWSKWALAQADRLDPSVGGTFLASLQDEEDAGNLVGDSIR